MKMNPWTLSVLLLLAGPLGADPDWHVEYPDSFCVVEGSTATIPCSFTHPTVHKDTGTALRVKQVIWCSKEKFCWNPTPKVYDSSNLQADSRFQYLGDLVGNCTLKIIKTVKRDAATYRFFFKITAEGYSFVEGTHGMSVIVNVTDGEDVKVRSSVTDHVVKEGGQVTLTCTSACSFHQLDVHWYRNGHALSETGPALHLSSLTNNNTGNYTCSLDPNGQNTSAPWCLLVGEDEEMRSFTKEEKSVRRLRESLVLLAVVLLLLAGLVFAKRRHAQKKGIRGDAKTGGSFRGSQLFNRVHFKCSSSRSAPGPEPEIVYSEVVG